MSLTTIQIPYSLSADEYFGEAPGILVGLPGRGWAPYLIVPEGYYALVTISGAEVQTPSGSPVWPPGFITAGPFTRISHLVTKSYCVFDIPVKGCKTSDNVTVTIDCSIVFRIMGDEKKDEDPELVRTFVHQVTPNGLEDQLKDAMAEEIRTLARSLKHTHVFTCRRGPPPVKVVSAAAEAKQGGSEKGGGEKGGGGGGGGQGVEMVEARELDEEEEESWMGEDVTRNMEARLNKQFKPQGVQIHDIMIQNISLPTEIMAQMSNKTMVKSKQDYEVMEQTFEMQSIRLKNDAAKLKLDHKEAQDLAKVEGGRNIQASRDQLKERQAERNKYLEDYKQQTEVEVSKVHAEMVEDTTRLDFEYLQVKQTLKLQSEEEAARVLAQTEAQIAELKAEAKLKIAELEGEAKKALAAAELEANQFLAKSREFELRAKQLDVYGALAANKDVVLSHTDTADFNMLLLADNVLAASGGSGAGGDGAGGGHAKLVAELNMLRLASNAYGLQKQGTYIPNGEQLGAAGMF